MIFKNTNDGYFTIDPQELYSDLTELELNFFEFMREDSKHTPSRWLHTRNLDEVIQLYKSYTHEFEGDVEDAIKNMDPDVLPPRLQLITSAMKGELRVQAEELQKKVEEFVVMTGIDILRRIELVKVTKKLEDMDWEFETTARGRFMLSILKTGAKP